MNTCDIYNLFVWDKRKRYVFAMMRAIKIASEPHILCGKGVSMTYGLRVLKSFEQVNGEPFNPFLYWHVEIVRGMGAHERFFRRVKALNKPSKAEIIER